MSQPTRLAYPPDAVEISAENKIKKEYNLTDKFERGNWGYSLGSV